MSRRLLVFGVGVSLLAFMPGPVTAQEVTSGTIEGTVADAQGAPLPGVTVILSSAQGTKTEVTDVNGRFVFTHLPAAEGYRLKAALQGFNTVERQNLDVRLGSRLRIEITLNAGVTEQIEVIGEAPVVDLSTTTTGATITSDLMASIPIGGRSFSNTLALAPGVVASGIDQSNPSIAGASGLENVYVIDGVNINNTGYGSAGSYSIVFGSLGMGVNFDYIKEVQVKTGGYEPEYGEALGGFVNLVTKTGGNEWKSSAFGYYQGAETRRPRTDRRVAAYDITNFESQDYGAEVSGPIVRDKAFFYGAFDPTFTTRTTRTAEALREAQGFDHELKADRTIWNYAANVKWLVHPKHTLSVSVFGDPATGDLGGQRLTAVSLLDPTGRSTDIQYGGNNVVARWEGELLENSFVEASFAYHRDRFDEKLARSLPNGTDFTTDPPRLFGGVGFFEDATSYNSQYRLKFSNFMHAAGEHNLRYGFEFQDIGYDRTNSYSGKPGLLVPVPVTRPGMADTVAFVPSTTGFIWDIDAASTRFRISRIRSGPTRAETNAHYTAFFISDSWSPVKWINVMGGLRFEEETLIGNLSKFNWENNWAPRAHLTIDPTKDNKTKVSFAYGRFFGKVPNDLAVRALSSEVTHIVRYPLSNVDLSDPNNPRIIDPTVFNSFTVFGNEPTIVDPKSKLTYQDEYVASVEREVIPALKVGVTYMHRRLGRTLEDVALIPYTEVLATGNFGSYFITNPGPNVLASNGQPGFPEPSRKYNAVTLKWERALRDRWQFAGSYTWSRLKGNYEGYYRRDNGQSDPFITSLFDFPYLATAEDRRIWQHTIEDGLLPNDRTHVFTIFGSYAFDFERTLPGTLRLGMSWRTESGVPITALGFNEAYGNSGEIALLPRGEGGRRLADGTVVPGDFQRGPTAHDIGLHADYTFKVRRQRIAATVRVLNLLNQQKGVDFDQGFELNGPGDTSPDFGKATEFQLPRRYQFALRATY